MPSLPRLPILLVVLLALIIPARAHDRYYGITNCYGRRHCAQNTCVFGIIVNASATDYTLKVTKTLRGRDVAGKRIRLRNSGWREIYRGTDVPLAVGDAIVVSYHSWTAQPFKPVYLVRSATTDWRTMTVLNGSQVARRDIDPFVQSGGRSHPLRFPLNLLLFLDGWGSLIASVLLLAAGGIVLRWRWMTTRSQ
ncbi:MAG: hypothetical protein ACYDCO_14010 [Armatimonadota bacterium]